MNRNLKRKVEQGKVYVFDIESDHADIHCVDGHDTPPKPFLFGFKQVKRNKFLQTSSVDKTKRILQNKDNIVICHNAKFEKEVMKLCKSPIKAKVLDTMLLMKVYRPDIPGQNYALDRITKLLFYKNSSWAEKLDKWVREEKRRRRLKCNRLLYPDDKSKEVTYNQIPKSIIFPYNKEDLRHTEKIFLYLIDHVDTDDIPSRLLHAMINPVRDMERTGVLVDVKYLQKCKIKMEKVLAQMVDKAKRITKDPLFNMNSPQQLGTYLGKKGILTLETPSSRKNSTGKIIYATGADILEQYEGKHPLIDLKIEYNKYNSLYTKYISKIGDRLDKDSALHTNIHTERAITFRLSTSKPSTQQFPKRKDIDKFSIRRLFIPREGCVFGCLDYSQIEYRLFSHYANIESLIEEYKENPNADYHSMTCRMMGLSEEERDTGKTINFMLIYGGGVSKLALKLKVSRSKAVEYWNAYMEAIPEYKPFASRTINEVRTFGGISDIFGHRYLCPSAFAYKGINYLIQGTAAQIMKISIVEVHKWLKKSKCKTKILWTIHDELLLEVPKDEIEVLLEVKGIMENFNQFKVPIIVDLEVAPKNWKDKMTYDEYRDAT